MPILIWNNLRQVIKIYPVRRFSLFVSYFLPVIEFLTGFTLKPLTKRQESLILVSPKTLLSGKTQIENLADVAELADAQASGACGLRLVEVRLLSSALSLL